MISNFKNLLPGVALLFMSASLSAGPRDDQVANVGVYVQSHADLTAYTYTIRNTGNQPILGFSIGFDHYTGASEISGDAPLEVISPTDWKSRIIALEESPYYEVRWEPAAETGRLEPGTAQSGFTVVMRNPNPQLQNSHWTAIIDGPPTYASSQLTVLDGPPNDLDTIPPSISVEFEPSVVWPPNNKIRNITASVTASDDKDPAPAITLVSVTCNECDLQKDVQGAEVGTADLNFSIRAKRGGQPKSGIVYTVVYSATDAAGNKSETSATIAVPHDQRKE
ncbi:hypothetical protein [Pseudomonas sp. TCU-HL1]|uniref:hypothetical protein n=1 Tax=Pseudomonas sp. TCU-HL1 TaxID=1856685 RepID=UPI0008573A40|nr:hypothetical protein [Pseudomonas sp. TCU-HL1]AOE86741.1 hypothetical protein THL1_4193 [Pseudomonas sp. TCU-HL1]